jgi:hypothetical protein
MNEEILIETLRNTYNIHLDIKYQDARYYLTANGHYLYSNRNFEEILKVIKAIFITLSNLEQ